MPPSSKRAAIILAGGGSSRFGSNKALALLADKPLVCRVAERLSSVAGEILVVIGYHEARAGYEAVLPSSVKIMNDRQEGKTPLIGIATGLQATKSEYAVICGCDVPFVKEEVVELLFQRASGVDAAIPKWNDGHIEPLEAVYRVASTLKAAQETLAPTGLPLRVMIGKLAQVVYVSVEDEIGMLDSDLRTFLNVNTREDMDRAEELYNRKYSPRRRGKSSGQ
ncbi:MAG: molybdenum cofactor guanylyltransferase [Candidatus Bathyarchaeia archaeon]|jgi:molybdopterin-guanine dinucleotide biosynthesis protein A